MTLGTNWAGSYSYRARELHRPASVAELQELLAGRAADPGARLAPHVQRHRGLRRARLARRAAGRHRGRRRHGVVRRGGQVRRARARARAGGAGAAQPRLAAAHDGGRRGRHRDARLGRRERQPGDGGGRARARHLDRRDRPGAARRRGLRRHGRRARRARGGHPPHARRRARVRGAPARVRGHGLGHAVRALRRDHRRRLQRQRLHAVGRRVGGLGQEPRRGSRRAVRGHARRPSTAIRSPASIRSTAPPSSACPARGGTGCRTSAWASPRAPARSCSPSSSSPACTRSRRSRPCARSPRASSRCSRSPSCARSPPTACG